MNSQFLWKCISMLDKNNKPIGYFVGNKGDILCHSEPNHTLNDQQKYMIKIANAMNLIDAITACIEKD